MNDAIVFVIGGGNYIEYQNLMDNAKAKSTPGITKRVIYGCTDLMNASQLINQVFKSSFFYEHNFFNLYT